MEKGRGTKRAQLLLCTLRNTSLKTNKTFLSFFFCLCADKCEKDLIFSAVLKLCYFERHHAGRKLQRTSFTDTRKFVLVWRFKSFAKDLGIKVETSDQKQTSWCLWFSSGSSSRSPFSLFPREALLWILPLQVQPAKTQIYASPIMLHLCPSVFLPAFLLNPLEHSSRFCHILLFTVFICLFSWLFLRGWQVFLWPPILIILS